MSYWESWTNINPYFYLFISSKLLKQIKWNNGNKVDIFDYILDIIDYESLTDFPKFKMDSGFNMADIFCLTFSVKNNQISLWFTWFKERLGFGN